MSEQAPVQVLAKVGVLLDCLYENQELTAGRLAELIGEPRSSVYRLLAALQELGFVESGLQRGGYRLGLKLLRLGSSVVAQFDERQSALPVMERIHEATGETVYLCVRRNREAVCIERIDGRHVQSVTLRLGGSLPLHAGAAPRLLLAFEPREYWEDYLSHGELQALTPNTPTTRSELFAKLESIRAKGYSVSDEDVTGGIAAIGAPIRDYEGTLRAALSISGLRQAILDDNEETTRELVVEGAREISRTLGFDAEGATSYLSGAH